MKSHGLQFRKAALVSRFRAGDSVDDALDFMLKRFHAGDPELSGLDHDQQIEKLKEMYGSKRMRPSPLKFGKMASEEVGQAFAAERKRQAERARKIGESHPYSEETRKIWSEKKKKWWDQQKGDKRRELVLPLQEGRKRWLENITPEEEQAVKDKIGAASARWWAELTEKERETFIRERLEKRPQDMIARLHAGHRRWWEGLSDDERAEFLDRRGKAVKESWDNMPKLERRKRLATLRQSRLRGWARLKHDLRLSGHGGLVLSMGEDAMGHEIMVGDRLVGETTITASYNAGIRLPEIDENINYALYAAIGRLPEREATTVAVAYGLFTESAGYDAEVLKSAIQRLRQDKSLRDCMGEE